MIYTLEYLRSHKPAENIAEIKPGFWCIARPINGTFRWEKFKAAWEVLRGRADAFTWPGNQ